MARFRIRDGSEVRGGDALRGDPVESLSLGITLRKVAANVNVVEVADAHLTSMLAKVAASLNAFNPPSLHIAASLAPVEAALNVESTDQRIMPAALARVYVRNPYWPRERIAELTSAVNADRAWMRMDAGQCVLQVNRYDEMLSADVLKAGNLIEVEVPDAPLWAGPMVAFTESMGAGVIEITALHYSVILQNRETPQTLIYEEPIGTTAIAEQLVGYMNAGEHTGIEWEPRSEAGPSVEEMQLGGQSIKEALAEMHARSDYEWWDDFEHSPCHLTMRLRWGFKEGRDCSAEVHLYEGVHFSELSYKLDQSQVKTHVTGMSDMGGLIPDRQSVTYLLAPERSTVALRSSSASEAVRRSVGSRPAGLRNEATFYALMATNTAELTRATQRRAERPLVASGLVSARVNRVADWHDLRVGNVVTLHSRLGLGTLDGPRRIVGMQRDEEMGECEIDTEDVLA